MLAISQAICEYRTAAGHRRPAVHRLRHPRAVGAGVRERPRGAGRQRRRGHDLGGRRIHADAGRLARHPHLQPRPRRPGSPTASSSRRRTIRPTAAASNTTRPTAARRTTDVTRWIETRANELLRSGSRRRRRVGIRRGAARRRPLTRTTTCRPMSSDLGAMSGHGRDPRLGHSHGRRPAGRRRRALLAAHRRALPARSHGGQRRSRSDLPFHDAGLGREDPHGSLLALCHAAADRPQGPLRHRLCLRHRPRSSRHRHRQQRSDAAESLPGGGDRLSVPPSHALACGRGRRQDRGEQRDDRPGRRAAAAASCTRCRWASNGSSTGCSTARLGFGGEESAGASFSRLDGSVWTTDKDGIVPALLSAEITARTGTRSRRAVPGSAAGTGRGIRQSRRRPGQCRAEEKARQTRSARRCSITAARRRADRADPDHGARQRRRRSAASRSISRGGWFAARPSGTEDIYKIYAESFHDAGHLGA